MNISIRKATVRDLPAIYALVKELAVYEKAPEEVIATLDTYIACFKQGIFDSLVAEADSEIVGTCIYYMTFSTWKGKMLYLEDFIVSEKYRRTGIGDRLFDRFIEEAKKQDCALVKWQVLDWNTPALRFYEKKHAIIEKEWWNGKIFLK